MSIDLNHPATVASLHMDFEVDNVSPADTEVHMLPQPNPTTHSLTIPIPDPSLPVFPTLGDPAAVNEVQHVPTSSHLAPAPAYLDSPTALDPNNFSSAAPPPATFIADYSSSFSVSPPLENNMAEKSGSLSPPLNPITPSGIHIPPAPFTGTSSLQSALDLPTGLVPATIAAPVLSAEPLPIASDRISKGVEMLHEVVQKASTAVNLAALTQTSQVAPGAIVDLVEDLREKLAVVSDAFKEMSFSANGNANGGTNGASDYPTPLPPILESSDFPMNLQIPAPTVPSGVLPPPIADSVSDLHRKRCADMNAERRVRLKIEPQDDLAPTAVNPYPSTTEISHIHALQSPPPSRPTSPRSAPFVFNPVKQPQTYPPMGNGIGRSTDPVMPKLTRSAWSEGVVPTRHSHSMSTGSISMPSLGRSPTDPTFQRAPPPQPQPQPVVPGRMNRSGSIGGSYVHPFTFSYAAKPVSQQWRGTTPVASTSVTPETVEDEGDDDDDYDSPGSGNHTQSPTTSDVPQEYRSEVDRVFFEYLNNVCSNLDATDSKGEAIHQTLMAKKMQRLDESPDFRPFKFRIQAFTNAFLEELAKQGYPEEKIPMKKIRNYLWRHSYIQRYNEDGRKAKSKGNHIWSIEAKKAGDGKWNFRPFHRKLAGPFPGVAYCGLRWSFKPRIWDPQNSWQNVPVHYSSPSLPPWLSWNGDELSGTPTPDAQSCDITVVAKFILDGQESSILNTFHINVAPRSAMDPAWAPRPSVAPVAPVVDLPRRASEPMLSRLVSRLPPTNDVSENAPARVVEVLQNVVARVTEKVEVSRATHAVGNFNHLRKQRHAVEQSLAAYDLALTGPTATETHQLAVAAQNVVAEAAQHAVAPRAAAAGITPSPLLAIQVASIGEMTDLTQKALAAAVSIRGSGSDLDVITTTSNILASHKAATPGSSPYVSPSSLPVPTFV